MHVRRSPPGELKHFPAGPIAENNGMPEAAAEPDINDLCRLLSLTQHASNIQQAHVAAFTIAIVQLGKHLPRLDNLVMCQENIYTKMADKRSSSFEGFFFLMKRPLIGFLAKTSNSMSPVTNPPFCLFCSGISADLQAFGQVIFDSLLPPMANRGDAAHTMHQLLGE